MIKTMNSQMTTNSQVSTTEPKKTKTKNKLSKQLEQEQNDRNGGHMEGYQWGRGRGDNGGKVTGNKKHKWQVENRQERLRLVWEMEKPKNLYVRPMDMN